MNEGLELYKVALELGTDAIFIDNISSEEIKCKINVDRTMTRADDIAKNEFMFYAVMAFVDEVDIETLRGSYFTRADEPTKKYLLISTMQNQYYPLLADIVFVECNEVIDVGYIVEEEDKIGNPIEVFTPVLNGISVYWSTNNNEQQVTDEGRLQSSVITVFLPATQIFTLEYIVRRKEFVPEKPNQTPPTLIYGYSEFYIDDMNLDLIETYDEVTFYGAIELKLTRKL